jgi:hypothetical protein
MEILFKANQIREKVRWVMGDPNDERIILVAFVGADAETFLDKPRGIKLYFWPNIPGTNPAGLCALRENGVELFAVENLHMKLYWSRKRGAVIGSANLTQNAFSDGALYELALYLPAGKIDIRQIMKSLVAKPVSNATLDELEERYNLYRLRNQTLSLPKRTTIRTFLQWYSNRRPEWRLFWWWEEANAPKDACRMLQAETGSEYYHGYVHSNLKNHYKKGQWVLCVKETYNQNRKIRLSKFEWFIPEIYSISHEKKWSAYKHFWFQIGKRLPSTIPFDQSDEFFKQAFKDTVAQIGKGIEDVVSNGTSPNSRFLNTLAKRYKELSKD